MEMQSQSSKPDPITPKDNKLLSLDDYHSFIDSNKQIRLALKKLTQIIGMHGFVRFQRTKNVTIEAVKSIDLMEPSRSTRNEENVSSNAFMTLEEAISDLKQLNWQECCVTSIQTVNSVNHDLILDTTGAPLAGSELKLSRKRSRRQAVRGALEDRDR
ncbi:hypothetical protein RHMOL_Rhmol04G0098600 [Rhododendron molle]|uniref:Uncharacterized protein n=1 Tax=Rhododendron molle TaxID=49168 RepID=A0ACC0NZ42_RHOML|nr:hypothetical protein RHMOL_Rhmol04G0098600 [Rhododendron molle]